MDNKMKRTIAVLLALTCSAALLSGCGSSGSEQTKTDTAASDSQQSQDIPTYTLEEIGENNSVRSLLSHHSALTYVETFTDENGDTTSVIRGQYTMNGDYMELSADYADESGKVTYYRQAYADATYAGAEYAQDADGKTYFTMYEDNDSYEEVTGGWLGTMPTAEGTTETVTETSMQDDAVVVTTRRDYRDEADMYEINLYYIDPETNDLLYTESTSYSTSDDSVVAKVATEITYDTPITFDVSPFKTITESKDYCEVNLIVDPQQDDMKVNWYPVAHGTTVYVVAEDGTKLYSDEALTKELSPNEVDISGAVCNIYMVRGK